MISFENFNIALFILVTTTIFVILLLVNLILSAQTLTSEKSSSYECGFTAFEFTLVTTDVNFYIIGLLFLIFDIELLFLLPWIMSINYNTNILGNTIFILFYLLLSLGFIYEFKTGAIDFDSRSGLFESKESVDKTDTLSNNKT